MKETLKNYISFWESKTDLVFWISLGAIVLTIALIAVLCTYKKSISTRTITYAGITIAASFTLSFLKVSPVTYGGSITLASMVPIIIFAYAFGFKAGILTGFIYGLLQFVSDPYFLTPLTFLLDYLLAFSSIACASLLKKRLSTMKSVISGVSLVYIVRFAIHFISGVLYFIYERTWASLPTTNAFAYSFLYQCVYLIPDFLITLTAMISLCKTGVFERLMKQMNVDMKVSSTIKKEPATENILNSSVDTRTTENTSNQDK